MAPFNLVNGDSVEVPRTSIALFQNEAETLRTPNRDLRAMFLGHEDRWDVTSFGERSFRAALATSDLYDGLVFGYNAIHESPELKAALRQTPPSGHMVILHQLGRDCLKFLQGDLALNLRTLTPEDGCAIPPADLSKDDEVLLNWPHEVRSIRAGDCQALRYFSFRPDSSWRVVLEVEHQHHHFPVLVRTAATAPVRIVVCSLLLDVRNEVHKRLLDNMLAYCMLGRPRIAVLDLPNAVDGYAPTRLAAKLRLQGASTMVVRPANADVWVGDWPLKLAERVVVPALKDGKSNPALLQPKNGDAHEHAKRWKKAGGAIVEIGADGTATAHMEVEDTHAILRRWAAWLHGTPEDSWAKHTFQLRAVLRMLDTAGKKQRTSLELRAPKAYADVARELLAHRVANGNLEETVGTTTAAYEIDRIVGGCMSDRPGKSRKSVEKWLRGQVGRTKGGVYDQHLGTALEERLDVARALADPELLARVLASVDTTEPLRATVVIRLREAAVACKADTATWKPELMKIDRKRLGGPELARELDGHLLASAEYVAAAAAFAQELTRDQEIAGYANDALDDTATWTVVATLARIGSLAQGQPQGRRSAQEVSAEALALYGYMGIDKSSTFQIWPQAAEIPAKAVESVLRELEKARKRRDETEGHRTALGLSVPIFAGIALGTMAAVLFARIAPRDGLHAPWDVAVFGWVFPPMLLFGIWGLLGRQNRDLRDVRLAKHALTPLSLLVALAITIWLADDLLRLGQGLTIGAFLLLASVALLLLDRIGLVAGWAPGVLAAVTNLGDTAASIRGRLSGGRGREEEQAVEVKPSESA